MAMKLNFNDALKVGGWRYGSMVECLPGLGSCILFQAKKKKIKKKGRRG
jgi:hypothetical protein